MFAIDVSKSFQPFQSPIGFANLVSAVSYLMLAMLLAVYRSAICLWQLLTRPGDMHVTTLSVYALNLGPLMESFKILLKIDFQKRCPKDAQEHPKTSKSDPKFMKNRARRPPDSASHVFRANLDF